MMVKGKCSCGADIPVKGGGVVYERDYCSTYCREFFHRGLKKTKGYNGSKHHKNHIGHPAIKTECVGCGGEFEMLSGRRRGRAQMWCKQSCRYKVMSSPVRKTNIVFTMLCMFKHNRKFGIYDGWMDSKQVFDSLSGYGNGSGKNIYATTLRQWANKGFLERRKLNAASRWEYRMTDFAMNQPLGKIFYEYSTKTKWDSND